jgi:hypothetical protein
MEQSPSPKVSSRCCPTRASQALARAHLQQAERHVHAGELRLENVRALVTELQHPAGWAETLLAQMEDILAAQISHRDRLRKEMRKSIQTKPRMTLETNSRRLTLDRARL